MATQASAQQQVQQQINQNNFARMAITGSAVKMTQNIWSQTFNPANQQQFQIPVRPVGLTIGFFVEVNMSVAAPGAGNTYSLSPFGPANTLSNITLIDLNNNTRHNTTGWHMHYVNSANSGSPFGAVRTNTTYPIAYGNNWSQVISAASVTGTTGGNTYMKYYVPCSFSDKDLRGAMFTNVVSGTAYLNLTLNGSQTAFVAAGADATNAVFQASGGTPTTGWGTTGTITVYQIYYDQLPVSNGTTLLPYLDLSKVYMLQNTSFGNITSGLDFPMSYPNFRDILSTTVVYDNGGTLDTGQFTQAWKLQSANFTNIFQIDPYLSALFSRRIIGDDWPNGVYYFDTRNKPISTVQFGNMQLVLTPTGTIAANATLQVGYEMMANVNTLVGAASINSGAV